MGGGGRDEKKGETWWYPVVREGRVRGGGVGCEGNVEGRGWLEGGHRRENSRWAVAGGGGGRCRWEAGCGVDTTPALRRRDIPTYFAQSIV